MALLARVEVAASMVAFQNVDLFQRGYYNIKARLKQPFLDNSLARVAVIDGERKHEDVAIIKALTPDHYIHGPTCTRDTYTTATFLVQYKGERVVLEDDVLFTCHVPIECASRVDSVLAATTLVLELELWFLPDPADKYGPKAKPPPSELKPVCKRELILHGPAQPGGLHAATTLPFTFMYACAVDLCLHSALITFSYENDPQRVLERPLNGFPLRSKAMALFEAANGQPAITDPPNDLPERVMLTHRTLVGGVVSSYQALYRLFVEYKTTVDRSVPSLLVWNCPRAAKNVRSLFALSPLCSGKTRQNIHEDDDLAVMAEKVLEELEAAMAQTLKTGMQTADTLAIPILESLSDLGDQVAMIWERFYTEFRGNMYVFTELYARVQCSRACRLFQTALQCLHVPPEACNADPSVLVRLQHQAVRALNRSSSRLALAPLEDAMHDSRTAELPLLKEEYYGAWLPIVCSRYCQGACAKAEQVQGFSRQASFENGALPTVNASESPAMICRRESINPIALDDNHLVVFVHGMAGHPYDLRHYRNHLLLHLPQLDTLLSQANTENTFLGLDTLTDNFIDEIFDYIGDRPLPNRISFVGHSMGTIVIRNALTRKRMAPLLPRLHTFVSFSGPHIGTSVSASPLISTGMWMLQKLKRSEALLELNMQDRPALRDCGLYRLAAHGGLGLFSTVVLVASKQDEYVSYASARIQRTDPLATNLDQDSAAVYDEMVTLLLQPFMALPAQHTDTPSSFQPATPTPTDTQKEQADTVKTEDGGEGESLRGSADSLGALGGEDGVRRRPKREFLKREDRDPTEQTFGSDTPIVKSTPTANKPQRLVRYDLVFPLEATTLDTLIGRAAHIRTLDSDAFIYHFTVRTLRFFL